MAREVIIHIAAPLDHQEGPIESPARFKVWRWGRRAGKTRGAFFAACVGHGAKPNGRGFLEGGEIIWVARDYPNSDVIWRKEILKRFANKPQFNVNKQDRRVTCEANGGTLTICSADNIDSVRGGDWDGVIVDEAAHQDLDGTWNEVIRPGLADRLGWAIIMSTTKTASYFNGLCERVIEGDLGETWQHVHMTAFDNEKISNDEIDLLISEYADEVKLKQEIYAELVVPGGFAFPEWNSSVHVSKAVPPPEWGLVGCMDWGYVNPGWFGLAALGPDTEVAFRWGFKFQKMEPFDVGYQIGVKLSANFGPVQFIVCDAQMRATTEGEVSIFDRVQMGLKKACGDFTPGLTVGPKGKNSRVNGKMQVHEGLKWTPHPDNPNKPISRWKAPRLTFHPDCGYAITTIPKLTRDERNPEDVNTLGEDHAYDAIRYLLSMVHRVAQRPDESRQENMDRHPGLTRDGRKSRWEPEVEEASGARYDRGLT